MANHHTRQTPELTPGDREELQRWARRHKASKALALRARIVLRSADGRSDTSLAADLGTSRATVGKWRRRFLGKGLDGLLDEPRSGAPRKIGDDEVERVIVETLDSLPPGGTHWSTRSVAAQYGLSAATVARIWQAFALKPHRHDVFRLSKFAPFEPEVRDIVGLYLHPPERAVALCVNDKSQTENAGRAQLSSPVQPRLPERRTRAPRRHGTTSLFAALDIATGRLNGERHPRHRAVEFHDFLKVIDESVPRGHQVHLVLDNYGMHQSAMIHEWLAPNSNFHLLFTPTRASWVNRVEHWFADLQERQIRDGTHRSMQELEAAVKEFLATHDGNPKPFVWTRSADQIHDSPEN